MFSNLKSICDYFNCIRHYSSSYTCAYFFFRISGTVYKNSKYELLCYLSPCPHPDDREKKTQLGFQLHKTCTGNFRFLPLTYNKELIAHCCQLKTAHLISVCLFVLFFPNALLTFKAAMFIAGLVYIQLPISQQISMSNIKFLQVDTRGKYNQRHNVQQGCQMRGVELWENSRR